MKKTFLFALIWITGSLLQTVYGQAADKFFGHSITDEGAWCWFADPRAIHYQNESGTINSGYLGYIDVHGNVKATQMDFLTGKRTEVLVRSFFQPDDHNNPTFLVLPDERILIIYSRHTDEPAFYYRVTRQPGDLSTLGTEYAIKTSHNTTYPSPFILSDDPGHFYLCWRGINWHPTIARLTLPDAEGKVNIAWGPKQLVQSTGARPYAKYTSNGKDKIYVTYTTGHPDNEQPNWVYYNAIHINAAQPGISGTTVSPTLCDIKGNTLSTIANGAFKVNKTNDYKNRYPLTVVDAPTDKRDWVWQTAIDTDGQPVIAMVRINGAKSQHEYYYAKWNGAQWKLTDLADGGGRFHNSNTEYCYSGGEAIDPENPNIIYLSIPTDGAYGKIYEIWKYTLNANGEITEKEQITRNSPQNNVRPWVLPGSAKSPLRLSWMHGEYQYWMVKTAYPKGYPTGIRVDYEWKEDVVLPAITATNKQTHLLTPDQHITLVPKQATSMERFTIHATLQLDKNAYYGTLLSSGTETSPWNYGVEEREQRPYVQIGNTRHASSNRLLTSDDWAIHSTGTSGDNWPTPLGVFSVTLTYDGHYLCTYRNGLLDQKLEISGLTAENIHIGGFKGTLYGATCYDGVVTSEGVKHLLQQQALESLYLPQNIHGDVILPGSIQGSNLVWSSSHPDIIDANGTYRAPLTTTAVTLTAQAGNTQRTFQVTVEPRNIEFNLRADYRFEPTDRYTQQGANFVKDYSKNGFDLQLYGNATVDGTLNLTANSTNGFATNGYAIMPEGVTDSLRSYTVLLTATPKSLNKAPRFYDLGANSGNSVFLRAQALSAGIKYAGGTTQMIHSGTALQPGNTYQLAVAYDAATRETRLYIDGKVAASGTDITAEIYQLAAQAPCLRNYLGRTQWWDTPHAADNADYIGTLDNISLYSIALTQAEICNLQGIRVEDPSMNTDWSTAITNRDFEDAYQTLNGSGVSSDRAIYVPKGWNVNYTSRDRNDMTILNPSCLSASFFAHIPTTGAESKNAYLVRQKWGTSTVALEQNCDTLSAGIYRLQADVWQDGMGGAATVRVKPSVPGTSGEAAGTAPSNKAAWQTASADFRCNGADAVTFRLVAAHTADGSEKFIGFDNVSLSNITANADEATLHALLENMEAAADKLLAGTLPSEAVRFVLNTANTNAKALTPTHSHEQLLAGYQELRHALQAVRHPHLVTDIQSVNANTPNSPAPIYDLSGRTIGKAATSESISHLRPGIYIHKNRKIEVQ